MRDFSTLHGSKRTIVVRKWNPGSDTNNPPDEVVRIQEWHRPEDDALIDDPAEVAELERRLTAAEEQHGSG
jgi:hypothetical protein